VVPNPGSPAIEDIIDRRHARLLHRTGNAPGAFLVYEDARYRWLENDDGTLHSVMDRRSPERLVLPYTAAMMAGLLFLEAPRSVLMLGLGGGSQARFLRHTYPDSRITAWESDTAVIDIARRHFDLPDDGESFGVINDDARQAIAMDGAPVDLILQDLFGAAGMSPWMRDTALHDGCRQRLAENGVLVSNFWVDPDDEFFAVMNGVQTAFENRTLVLAVPGYRNFVVLAFNATPRIGFVRLRKRAIAFGKRTGLDCMAMISRMCESNISDETGFLL
jgi:spermidine synthase